MIYKVKHLAFSIFLLLVVELYPVAVIAAENIAGDFESTLSSFEVEGISLSTDLSKIEKILVGKGFTLDRRSTQMKQTRLLFIRRKGEKSATIDIRVLADDTVSKIDAKLFDFENPHLIDQQGVRHTKAFENFDTLCKTRKRNLVCKSTTDRYKSAFIAKIKKNGIYYTLSIKLSAEAQHRKKDQKRKEKDQEQIQKNQLVRAERKARQEKVRQEALAIEFEIEAEKNLSQEERDKRSDEKLRQWIANIKLESETTSADKTPQEQFLAAAKKRIVELNKLPPDLRSLSQIQKEWDHARRNEILIEEKYIKFDPSALTNMLVSESGTLGFDLYRLGWGHSISGYAKLIEELANMKARKAPEYMFTSIYPDTAEGLLGFMDSTQYKAKSIFSRRPNFLGRKAFDTAYAKLIKTKSEEHSTSGMAIMIAELRSFDGMDYGDLRELNKMNLRAEKLQQLSATAGYHEFNEIYLKTKRAMLKKSIPVLVNWINSLPPSMKTLGLLDKFEEEAFGVIRDIYTGKGNDTGYFPVLFAAISVKRTECNPDGYYRPDIILSLTRRYWREVKLRALDDFAYISTTVNNLGKSCPGLVTDAQKRIISIKLDSAKSDALYRLYRGQPLSRKEAEMGTLLAMNTIFNRPGCREDNFGNITSCTSEEEFRALNQVINTSSAALQDTATFKSKNSCSSQGMQHYIKSISDYMNSNASGAIFPEIPDFPYIKSDVE